MVGAGGTQAQDLGSDAQLSRWVFSLNTAGKGAWAAPKRDHGTKTPPDLPGAGGDQVLAPGCGGGQGPPRQHQQQGPRPALRPPGAFCSMGLDRPFPLSGLQDQKRKSRDAGHMGRPGGEHLLNPHKWAGWGLWLGSGVGPSPTLAPCSRCLRTLRGPDLSACPWNRGGGGSEGFGGSGRDGQRRAG